MSRIPDVTFVKALPGHRLHVRLSDEREGVFEVAPFLQLPGLSNLNDLAYFKRVGLMYGAVSWPNEEDISPDPIAAALMPLETAAQTA